MTCRFCGRPITSEESRKNGAGHTCLAKRQTGEGQPELFEGLARTKVSRIPLQLEPVIVDWDALRGKERTN